MALGTFLLRMPWANVHGEKLPYIDALFTATSALTVTGLTVVDTGSYFTFWGQVVILALIQMGGIGIMALGTLFGILLKRRLFNYDSVLMEQTGGEHIVSIRTLLKRIIVMVLVFEALGTVMLMSYWGITRDLPPQTLFWDSLFHTISAFCNAGFGLYSDSLQQWSGDWIVNLIFAGLIIAGGMGFLVLWDLSRIRRWDQLSPTKKRFSLQTQVVLTVTTCLVFGGAALMLAFEWNHSLAGKSVPERILCALFESVSSRSAGFSTIDNSHFSAATLFVLVCLMFVGAGPGSCAGGIKVTTLGILHAWVMAAIKNRPGIFLFKKTIPQAVFQKAALVFVLSLTWILVVTLCLCASEQHSANQAGYFLKALFKTTSAFGTVGLWPSETTNLSSIGRLLLTLTMFVGRIGTLTVVLAMANDERSANYKYPVESIMIG